MTVLRKQAGINMQGEVAEVLESWQLVYSSRCSSLVIRGLEPEAALSPCPHCQLAMEFSKHRRFLSLCRRSCWLLAFWRAACPSSPEHSFVLHRHRTAQGFCDTRLGLPLPCFSKCDGCFLGCHTFPIAQNAKTFIPLFKMSSKFKNLKSCPWVTPSPYAAHCFLFCADTFF